jgi:hypothetical protein
MRVMYYQCMSLLEDKETEKKGIVIVVYAIFGLHDRQPSPDAQLMKRGIKLLGGLPLRVQARHVCTDSKSLGLFISCFSPFMDRNARVRARAHIGTLHRSSSKQCIGFTMVCLHLYFTC